jgi:hypothetical protein
MELNADSSSLFAKSDSAMDCSPAMDCSTEKSNPGLSKFTAFDPVDLHPGANAHFARVLVSPLARKPEQGAFGIEPMVINNDTNIRPLLADCSKLRRIGPAGNGTVTLFVVPDILHLAAVATAWCPDAIIEFEANTSPFYLFIPMDSPARQFVDPYG